MLRKESRVLALQVRKLFLEVSVFFLHADERDIRVPRIPDVPVSRVRCSLHRAHDAVDRSGDHVSTGVLVGGEENDQSAGYEENNDGAISDRTRHDVSTRAFPIRRHPAAREGEVF